MTSDNLGNIPNLFVVGVPKAGSTSLYKWLSDHPEIGGSADWELRYLMDIDDPLVRKDGFHVHGAAGYSRFYRDRIGEGGIRYLIDVTPQYYYQKTACDFVSSLPERKVLMILRKPSRRLYSLYKYAMNNIGTLPKGMDFPSFVEHLHRGRHSSVFAGKRMLEDALDHSTYIPFIHKWAEAIGREHLKVVLFEDLVKDPHKVTKDIAWFLGIASSVYDGYSFDPENTSVAVRNRSIHRFYRKNCRLVPAAIRRSLKPYYFLLNSRKSNPLTDEDQTTLTSLDDHFHESEVELAKWLEREIPLWR